MRGVGKALFGGSRFVRWTLLPCIALSALVVGLDSSDWTQGNALKFGSIEVGHILLFLAIGWPQRFRWAGRILGLVVFAACVFLLVHDINERPAGVPWTDTNVWRAVKATLVFGLPSLWYAVRGRFGFSGGEGPQQPVAPGGPLPVLPENRSVDEQS